MKIKLYLSKPGTGKKADQLRKTVLKDYESGVPLEQIIERTNHKDTDSLLRYIEKIKIQDREKANQQTAIYANVSYSMKVAKIYTGKSILPAYWNPKTNQARNTPKFPQFPEFNEWLKDFKDTIEKVFIDYEIKYKEQPTPAALRDLVKAALHKRQPNKQTFLSYFEDFVNRSLAGDRIDPRSKKPVRHGVAKGYKTTLAHLKAFSETWARELTFANIDLEFHADYIRYLKTEGKSKDGSPLHLSANTIGSHIQRIKAVMSEATERGINSNLAFKSRYFIKQTEDADTIYLDEKEIKEMLNLDLSENDRLQNARDLFLIGCYTGLRFSDFSRLTLENIKGDYIKIVQLKTGAPVTIPIHKVVRGIIEKHNGFPRPISDIKLNAYLKEIGQLMQTMSKVESKTITKGGSVITKMSPKWQFLTTHAARRSFATNEYLAGTPILTLMAVTGHKSIKSFLKYIRVTQDEQAVGMKAGWDDREKLKAV